MITAALMNDGTILKQQRLCFVHILRLFSSSSIHYLNISKITLKLYEQNTFKALQLSIQESLGHSNLQSGAGIYIAN